MLFYEALSSKVLCRGDILKVRDFDFESCIGNFDSGSLESGLFLSTEMSRDAEQKVNSSPI